MPRAAAFHNRKLVSSTPDPISPRPSRAPYDKPLASMIVWWGFSEIVNGHQVTLDLDQRPFTYIGSNVWRSQLNSLEGFNTRCDITWDPRTKTLHVATTANTTGSFVPGYSYTWTAYDGTVEYFTGLTDISGGISSAQNSVSIQLHGPYRLPSV